MQRRRRQNWVRELCEEDEKINKKESYENVYFDLDEESVNRTGNIRKRIFKEEYAAEDKDDFENVYFDLDEEFINRTGKSPRTEHEDFMPQSPHVFRTFYTKTESVSRPKNSESGWVPPLNNPEPVRFSPPNNPNQNGTESERIPWPNNSESGWVPPRNNPEPVRIPLPNNPEPIRFSLPNNRNENRTESERIPRPNNSESGWVPPRNNPEPVRIPRPNNSKSGSGWVPPLNNPEPVRFSPPNNWNENGTESEWIPHPRPIIDRPHFFTWKMRNRSSSLFVPYEVVKDNNLQLPKNTVIRDTRGNEWKTKLTQWNDGRLWYLGGLSSFWRMNQIQEDVECVVEFVEDEVKGLILLIYKI